MSTGYELRVEGHLDHHWTQVLDGFSVRHDLDGTTALTGQVLDQAQLHGLLARLRDLGVSLLGVRALPDESAAWSGAFAGLAWPRHTDRLVLRPALPQDAEATWRFRHLESVSRWLTELPRNLDSYRVAFEDPARLARTLVMVLDGQVVGDLMLRVEDAWGQTEVAAGARASQAELAWVLDPQFVGQGYATEAARELVRLCFEELALRRVVATCFADNVPSWRLMERIGMRRELHAVGDALHRSGGWRDTFAYAALADEWDHGKGSARGKSGRSITAHGAAVTAHGAAVTAHGAAVQQAELAATTHRAASAVDPELGVDVPRVGAQGVEGDDEVPGQVGTGEVAGEQPQDDQLPVTERVNQRLLT
jgi:RimJ/RimL family protein N-acetyltransferase